MKTYRVLLPDGESHFSSGVVRALGAAGNYACCVQADSNYVPARFSRQCQMFAVADGQEDFVARLMRQVGEWSADVLLPVDEAAIRATIVASRELERFVQLPPLPTAEAFDTARDKASFARFLQKHGLSHPATLCLPAAGAELPPLDALDFPVLLKPARSSNGIGIVLIETPEALAAHWQRHPESAAGAVVQTFIEGDDIDCSVLCLEGRVVAHTVQRAIAVTSGGFRSAGAIEFVDDERVLELATDIMRELRWSGIAHLDMRRERHTGRLYAIEVNPRYWGSLLGSLQAGVNFPDLACRIALGQALPAIQRRACRYLSGTAAVRAWIGRLPSSKQPIPRRTALAHIWPDPGPELLEAAAGIYRRWNLTRNGSN